jgi:hypothetical protein
LVKGSSTEGSVHGGRQQIKLVVVVVGIALFVLGFMLTVSSLSTNGTGTEDGATSGVFSEGAAIGSLSLLMIIGMSVSFAGVLIATVGPMASFMQNKAR